MGYAIVGGAGLLIGLGLLIWGLRERTAKYDALRLADTARSTATSLRQALDASRVMLNAEREAHEATRRGAGELRDVLERLRVQLRTSKDPATVKAWLDVELDEMDV